MPKIPGKELQPFYQTTDQRTVRLYQGNSLDVLRRMPSQSVHMVVTSPPYWGLRDYGTASWSGGSVDCDHISGMNTDDSLRVERQKVRNDSEGIFARPAGWQGGGRDENMSEILGKDDCPKCGATRIDSQLGSEKSPDEFVANMVAVFREVRRVLRDDGTLWLNLGDTYGGYSEVRSTADDIDGAFARRRSQSSNDGTTVSPGVKSGLKSGNLVGIPWRVALALQADGWVLRQDIIWAKPSPMPESVKNRCTKSHEYVFLLTKKMGYFYDSEAIKESAEYGYRNQGTGDERPWVNCSNTEPSRGSSPVTGGDPSAGRNKRSVWNVSSQGYPGAHFATYPPKLIEPMILAGTSEYGCCVDCGAPWKRVVEEKQLTRERPNDYVKRKPGGLTGGAYAPPGQTPHSNAREIGNTCANSVAGVESTTVGWKPTCECRGKFVKRKGKRLGYGSYHDHEQDGVEYGLIQSGQTFTGSLSKGYERPLKELDTTIIEYVSDIPLDEHPVQPAIVLDPFIGSGTTCCVAIANGRHSIGIDLSEKYLLENAIPRIEGELLSRPALKHLTGRQAKRLEIGRKLT